MQSSERPEAEVHQAKSLAGSPAVRRAECWWLTASSGAVPADAELARALDRAAADLAAADRAVTNALETA